MLRIRAVAAFPLLLAAPVAARDAGPVTAFVGARVLPISGPEIPDGVVVVRGSRIEAVGAAGEVRVPSGALVVDLAGRVLMPGLVDTHSHVGGGWGADGSAPIQPDVRVLDSIDCRNTGFQRAQAGGITTVNVMPGSGHLMSGQTAYLKVKDANTIEEMAMRDSQGRFLGGMKMANGTNSQRDAPFPGTRSKSAALVRDQFVKARRWMEKNGSRSRGKRAKGKEPERDLAMEALAEVLRGERIVHHHTHRHDDIVTVLRLQREFGFRVVLHHVSEAWKVADEIAAARVPSSIIVLDSPGGKLEAAHIEMRNGAVLEAAGAPVAFHTDDWITDSRLFLRSAALGVRAGMSREGALRAVTIAGATMLDLEDRVGTLERGKDADMVVLSGDPLSTYTQVLQTWVEGRKVFDREDPRDRLWAEGGWGAGDRRAHVACGEEDR